MPTRRDELAARRIIMGFTQESLARRVGVEPTTVKRWELGHRTPGAVFRSSLAAALQVTLVELERLIAAPSNDASVDTASIQGFTARTEDISPSGVPESSLFPVSPLSRISTGDDEADRVAGVVSGAYRNDHEVVKWLERCLAENRRVEDAVGARPLLGVTRAQLRVVDSLVRETPGELSDQIISLAAQYGQFMAWLCNDLGDKTASRTWYDRSHAWAVEASDANMAATTLTLKAHLAWSDGRGRQVIHLAEAALWPSERLSPGIQGMATQMKARGYATTGDHLQARSLLDEAEGLLMRAAAHPEDEPPWQYFYDTTWLMLQRGMVELQLAEQCPGAAQRAVTLLSAGLVQLPTSYRRDRAWYGVCLARAQLAAGELEAGVQTAKQFAGDAMSVNRYATQDLRQLVGRLVDTGVRRTVVAELRELLAPPGDGP